MKKDFTKNDLQKGMCVVTRDRGKGIVTRSTESDSKYDFINLNDGNCIMSSRDLTEDLYAVVKYNMLMPIRSLPEFDIVAVYSDYTMTELLWERKEIKLTEDEKAILRNLVARWKYIARDKNGKLYIYTLKPYKKSINAQGWSSDSGDFSTALTEFISNLFSFIKWEDEEPYLISDLLEG